MTTHGWKATSVRSFRRGSAARSRGGGTCAPTGFRRHCRPRPLPPSSLPIGPCGSRPGSSSAATTAIPQRFRGRSHRAGAPPRLPSRSLAAAARVWPVPARPIELTPEALDKLSHVSTATITTQLLRRGFRSTFIQGLRPTRPDLPLVGYAFTLRYVPAREDVAFNATFDNETDVQRLAIESVGPGDVLVIDGRSEL